MGIAVITGASSGIGKDFAKKLSIMDGVDELWLIARRKDFLNELASKMDKPCRIIDVDLSDGSSFDAIKTLLKTEHAQINWLVNSAGYGLIGRFDGLAEKNQSGIVDVNCTALTKMIEICLPYMSQDSHIINMASAAAFLPQPEFSVYAASKSYVLSLSRALRNELRSRKINVLAVCPGPVDTDFFKTAESKDTKMKSYKKLFMISSEKVVSGALRSAQKKKAVYVPSFKIKLLHAGTKILPHSLLIKIVYG